MIIAADRSAQRRQTVLNFVGLQLFSMLYLEKFAVGPETFRLGVPMLIMAASLVWMIVTGNLALSRRRLALYFAFVSFCVLSQILAGLQGSITSILNLILDYSFLLFVTELDEDDYREYVLKRYVRFMILPALIVLFQYSIQKVLNLPDPLNMNAMLPKTILQQGFYYNAPYPVWTSKFTRPNGFFFLEPSFISLFTASAAIIEITFFRRWKVVVLMIVATIMSTGGTGTTMLLFATPFLLTRENPKIALTIGGIGLVGLVAAFALGYGDQLPLVSRLGELDTPAVSGQAASASGRMLVPAGKFVDLIMDGGYFLTGTGAGSTTVEFGSVWPTVKLLNEYGALTMVTYLVLFTTVLFGDSRSNLPLKVAIFFTFQFTGGYLLDDILVIFIALLCMNKSTAIAPQRSPRDSFRLTEIASHG